MLSKAVLYDRYGGPEVLELRDVERPALAGDEVLVRVHAASLNPLDWHFMRGSPYAIRLISGLLKPKSPRLGVDLAGVVEAVGTGVTEYRPGDEVYGGGTGAFAEHAVAPTRALAPKSAKLTFEQAAAVPIAGWTALQFLRDLAGLQAGQSLLVNGASGGVGTFAVQIAKALGAEVTGVCSTPNVELVLSIGADRVVDYTREDFTESDARYDFIFDNVGNRSFADCRRVMATDGTFLMCGGPDGRWLGPAAFMMKTQTAGAFASQRVVSCTARRKSEDLRDLNELFEAGTVVPVVGREYALSAIREAMAYLETGHARGKVVVKTG